MPITRIIPTVIDESPNWVMISTDEHDTDLLKRDFCAESAAVCHIDVPVRVVPTVNFNAAVNA